MHRFRGFRGGSVPICKIPERPLYPPKEINIVAIPPALDAARVRSQERQTTMQTSRQTDTTCSCHDRPVCALYRVQTSLYGVHTECEHYTPREPDRHPISPPVLVFHQTWGKLASHSGSREAPKCACTCRPTGRWRDRSIERKKTRRPRIANWISECVVAYYGYVDGCNCSVFRPEIHSTPRTS